MHLSVWGVEGGLEEDLCICQFSHWMGMVQARSAKICMPRNLKALYHLPMYAEGKALSVPDSMEVKYTLVPSSLVFEMFKSR